MTHEDAGKYSAKHPAGTTCDPVLAEEVRQKAQNERLTCSAAHEIAERFNVVPAEVGKTIDLLEYRITKCQMGLFGYSPEKKIVGPAEEISDELRNRIENAANDEKISCAECWKVAGELGIKKMAVSSACEALGIKITPCQLGAF